MRVGFQDLCHIDKKQMTEAKTMQDKRLSPQKKNMLMRIFRPHYVFRLSSCMHLKPMSFGICIIS